MKDVYKIFWYLKVKSENLGFLVSRVFHIISDYINQKKGHYNEIS